MCLPLHHSTSFRTPSYSLQPPTPLPQRPSPPPTLPRCRDLPLVQRYTRHMEQHVLLPADGYKSAVFSYHLADIFLPEFLKEATQGPPPAAPFEALLEPCAEAMCHCVEASALSRYR